MCTHVRSVYIYMYNLNLRGCASMHRASYLTTRTTTHDLDVLKYIHIYTARVDLRWHFRLGLSSHLHTQIEYICFYMHPFHYDDDIRDISRFIGFMSSAQLNNRFVFGIPIYIYTFFFISSTQNAHSNFNFAMSISTYICNCLIAFGTYYIDKVDWRAMYWVFPNGLPSQSQFCSQ